MLKRHQLSRIKMTATKAWVRVPPRSPFSLANIPFGIISTISDPTHRPAAAIGDFALDLSAFARADGFSKLDGLQPHLGVFNSNVLNDFAALGRQTHQAVRQYLQSVFAEDGPYPDVLKDNKSLQETALLPLSVVQSHLPLAIGDYTDFYAGRNHAFNVGTLFRGPQNALNPNYHHIPVAYHGRASSVIVSGTPIRRPRGQIILDPAAEPKVPTFAPCKRLDIEVELGMFISRGNELGKPVPINRAHDYIFGYVLMNDWSARDVQMWEYVPLGPFNGKNFGTTISPWVVLADALEPFRTKGIDNPIALQSYLQQEREDLTLDINLEVVLKCEKTSKTFTCRHGEPNPRSASRGNQATISHTSSRNLMWSWEQMIAHHTVTGCNLRVGDLLGSGTISGDGPGTYGSMLEPTQNGKKPIKLNGNEDHTFLEDGDSVVITGLAGEIDGALVGFGECSAQILPALDEEYWHQ